jgi:hypothetical protein
LTLLAAWVALLLGTGCRDATSNGTLVLTQTPVQSAGRFMPVDRLDLWYPAGSRVVRVARGQAPDRLTVLSPGFHAAGSPVVSPDGARVLFAGKATSTNEWQIYEVASRGGRPRALTAMTGGAMSPALLPDGRFVFCSPVPRAMKEPAGRLPAALYVQSLTGGVPQRLTFGLQGVSDATALPDGRILFASAGAASAAITNVALFTVNNDGTEVEPYACQHDGHTSIRRPRELPDGRVVFLTAGIDSSRAEGQVEQVLTARPFSSRRALVPELPGPCRSIEAAGDGEVLLTMKSGVRREDGAFVVFRLRAGLAAPGEVLFEDPAWNQVEALAVVPRPPPMGRLSNVDTNRATGMLLCLNANDTTSPLPPGARAPAPARRLRVLTERGGEGVAALGEFELKSDGSFLAEVPSDVVLGFEALDADGQVLRRLPPSIWVRPGENRSCIGCHERHGQCPENHRPLAVQEPAVRVGESSGTLAQDGRRR